jgi:hypothetical protein
LTGVPGLTTITTNLGAGLASGANPLGASIGQSAGGVSAENAVRKTFWSLLIGALVAASVASWVAPPSAARSRPTDVRGDDPDAVYPRTPVATARVTDNRVVSGGLSRDADARR